MKSRVTSVVRPFGLNSPFNAGKPTGAPWKKTPKMTMLNAKCNPPILLHKLVRVQAAVRRFLFNSRFRGSLAIENTQPPKPNVALALYLARRLRNGNRMDTSSEVDDLARELCSSTSPDICALHDLCTYCERCGLQSMLGYILVHEKVRDYMINIQNELRRFIADKRNDVSAVRARLRGSRNMLPSGLHLHLEFAETFVSHRQEDLEAKFQDRIRRCISIQDLERIGIEITRALPAESLLHEFVISSILQRRESLRFEIQTMYDHPLTDGNIPELESAARRFLTELPISDTRMRDFAVDICFLFLRYKKQMRSDFDPREEMKSFAWSDKLGAHVVFPLFLEHCTPSELLDIFATMVKRTKPKVSDTDETRREKLICLGRLVQIGRRSSLNGIDELINEYSSEIVFDVDDIWDMLGDDFELPILGTSNASGKMPNVALNELKPTDVAPVVHEPRACKLASVNECARSDDQYVFFGGAPPRMRQTLPASVYKVTRFPSRPVVL